MPDKKLTELPENTSANNNDKIYIASAGGVSKFIRLSTLVNFIVSLLPPPTSGGDSVRVFLGRIAPADIPTTGELGEYFINSTTLTYWQWTPDDSEDPEGPGSFQDTGDPVQDVEADTAPTLGSVNYVLSDGIYQALTHKANTEHSHSTSEAWLSDLVNLLVLKSGFIDQLAAKTEQGTGIVLSVVDGKLVISRSGGDGESGDWGSIGGNIEDQTDLKNTYSKIPVWTPVEPVAGQVTLPAVNGTNDYYEWTESGPDTLAHSGIFKDAGYKWGRVTLGSSSYTITLGAGYINPDGSAKPSIVLEGSPGQVREFQLVRKGSVWIVYEGQESTTNHYKGTYTSLANLQAAHPTAEAGDEAIVDEGVGTNAVKYIWDDTDEEWVPGGGVGASSFSDLAGAPTDNAALASALTAARDRANHTGTQLASTISDFAATVRATVLTGLSTAASSVITATDTVLSALGKLQAQITEKWVNITSGNDQQIIYNDLGTASGDANLKWNKTSKRLTIVSSGNADTDKGLVVNNANGDLVLETLGSQAVRFGGTSHQIIVPESVASGDSNYQIPNSKLSAWKMKSLTETYVEADTSNKRWIVRQELAIDQGFTPRIIKQGGQQSTGTTAVVLETIPIATGDVILLESTISAKTSGAAQTLHHIIRRRFKNVAGTVTALGTLTQVEYSAEGFTAGDGITTGARGEFNINGTNIEVRFIGQASLTVDATSTTERSYR